MNVQEGTMTVRHRNGRWTLGKKSEGVFIVKKGGQYEAKILTDDHDPDDSAGDERRVHSQLIEVPDYDAARNAYLDYVDRESVPGIDT